MISILFEEGVIIHHTELPIPGLMFGIIAFASFLVLAAITWSYRDVANRHSHKESGSRAGH
ncbi:MAG: hypothetical protein ACI9SV_000055 [Aquiluna sp.]|jgi:hypothetical protein|uniref:hypothetical protein n=1 Tax=Aquiluna sp. TaxID=2053504 RepID=UPI000713118E|nr:MAG: hypothetical protein ABR68_00610 [Microbacteriaceae bacterium BACL28 MAG-120531-bin53]NQV92766.1 hypothetical protein [Aquiluna sp.]HAE74009.1 hypothetical protein [Aquiluna sp.]